MSKLIRVIDGLIEREGAFVDHPDDKGGATMYGITQKVARLHGWDGDMRHLPRALAVQIYKDHYWSAPNFDRVAMLSTRVAEELLDTGAQHRRSEEHTSELQSRPHLVSRPLLETKKPANLAPPGLTRSTCGARRARESGG